MWRLLFGWSLLWGPALCAQTVTVPFVGCRADGQVGPLGAPHGKAKVVKMPVALAARLAWYEAGNAPGVFAPRGWQCFGTYGSNGGTLFVSPERLDSRLVFSDGWKGFAGPAIQISSMDGSTSGRFEVARRVAQLFPEHMDFARAVIAEGLEPAKDFPQGPYPGDKLAYKTKTLVEFETPPHHDGLGTDSRLLAGDGAITGFVFLSAKPDDDAYDVSLEVRLPAELAGLGPAIVAATERVVLARK